MKEQRAGSRRTNALGEGRELVIRTEEHSTATAEVLFDLLTDLRSHLEWAGVMQGKKTRLISLQAPEGPARVGTEFETTGADPMGRFMDRSVVTEATPHELLEFVTEARLDTKKGVPVDWTLIHRYELSPKSTGCRIVYTERVTRVSALPGMLAIFGVPVLRGVGLKVSAAVTRRSIRNLATLAEQRVLST